MTCSNVSQVIHTTCSLQHAVNAKSRVVFLQLASFHFSQCVNWRQTRVFCQCQRYTLQCIREGTECILLQGRDLTNANVTCIIHLNTDQLRTKSNPVSSKFTYFPRNEKCGSHWKGNVISSMNGRDLPHSHHLYYRLSQMTVA